MVGHSYTPHRANTQCKRRRSNRLDDGKSASANTNSPRVTILHLPGRVQGRYAESHERLPRQSRCQTTEMERHFGRLLEGVGISLYLETFGMYQFPPYYQIIALIVLPSQESSYGENLAYGYQNVSAAVIAWGDEGELYNFDKPTGFTEATGHFTQLVWKSTTQVGCAAVNCGYTKNDNAKRDVEVEVQDDVFEEDLFEGVVMTPRFSVDEAGGDGLEGLKVARGEPRAQGWYVVCEYTPPGNVVGLHDSYFKKNVLPESSSSTKSSSSTTSESSSTSITEPSPNAATSTTIGSQSQPTGGAMRFALDSTLGMMLVTLGAVGVGRGLYT